MLVRKTCRLKLLISLNGLFGSEKISRQGIVLGSRINATLTASVRVDVHTKAPRVKRQCDKYHQRKKLKYERPNLEGKWEHCTKEGFT